MSQDVQNEILSEVNSQSLNLNDATSLSNALKQNNMDFTQQTLMDVNSQPLIHNMMESHGLINSLDSTNSIMNNQFTMENNAIDPSSPVMTEFYEKFAIGRMFPSLDELRNEAFEYGRKHNVALTTSKSDKTKIYLICKHGGHYRKNTRRQQTNKVVKPRIRRSQKTGCPCMIYARCCRGSFWVVRKSIGEHNHPIANDPRTYAMYRSLSPEHLLIVHRLLREHVGVSFIVKSLKANGVTNILPKDIENIQQDLKRRDVLELSSNPIHTALLSSNSDTVVTPIPTNTTTTSSTTATNTTMLDFPNTDPNPSQHLLITEHKESEN